MNTKNNGSGKFPDSCGRTTPIVSHQHQKRTYSDDQTLNCRLGQYCLLNEAKKKNEKKQQQFHFIKFSTSGKRAFTIISLFRGYDFYYMCTDIIEVRVKVEYLKCRNVYIHIHIT